MLLVILFLLTLFFLMGSFFLTAVISSFRRFQKRDSQKQIKALGNLLFYRPFHHLFFRDHEYESLFFATICAQNISRFCYAACAILFLTNTQLGEEASNSYTWFWLILSFGSFILAGFVFGDYLPRILGNRFPEASLKLGAPFASIFLYLAFPLSFIFLKLSQPFSRTVYFDSTQEPEAQVKQEIIDIIQETKLSPTWDPHDKELIERVFTFRDLIAREVMVPRVEVFSLAADTKIKDAAKLIIEEGYSRIPVYRNSVDNIVGVLMYKDILNKYREYAEKGNDPAILEAPIETIQKAPIYTPETKKISSLLQEFRKKQVHLAIVVDEYGGTEGIVTIEDILEELVGDIADEYDQEEELFFAQPDGGWVVDARMTILDAEEELGVVIPQEGDYDTIGGYIFHVAGEIPQRGFVIHHDNFEIEVLRAGERSVERVRIKPVLPKAE